MSGATEHKCCGCWDDNAMNCCNPGHDAAASARLAAGTPWRLPRWVVRRNAERQDPADYGAVLASLRGYLSGSDALLDPGHVRAYLAELYEHHVREPRAANGWPVPAAPAPSTTEE